MMQVGKIYSPLKKGKIVVKIFRIWIGKYTKKTTQTKDNINDGSNNINNKNQNRNDNNNTKITTIHSTTILKDFLASLHYVFLLSAILMFISIIPSWIRGGNNYKNASNRDRFKGLYYAGKRSV